MMVVGSWRGLKARHGGGRELKIPLPADRNYERGSLKGVDGVGREERG